MVIGILAIQGSVIEHRAMLERLDVEVIDVRLPEDLEGIQGIILPGGESTTQSKLMRRFGLFEVLQQKIKDGLPAWGTCAGAILLAKVVGQNCEPSLEAMDIEANRNAYGRQIDSFDISLSFQNSTIEAVFIRAPKLTPLNDAVEVLCEHQGQPVILRQAHLLASSFHPELTDDTSVHEYFLSMINS